MKSQETPQAPDWQLEPIEQKEATEVQETTPEAESMDMTEAAEKYSVAEELPAEQSVKQEAQLDTLRETIKNHHSGKEALGNGMEGVEPQPQPEEKEFRRFDEVYNAEQVALLEDMTRYGKGKEHLLSGDFEEDFTSQLRDLRSGQEDSRKKATLITGTAVVSAGVAAGLTGVGVMVAAPFLIVPAGVWGGMKLYHRFKNKRLEKRAQALA